MIREFLTWLQNSLGKGEGELAQSWSEALLGSLNFWGIVEGTHVLALMLFAGTILVVDLRLLGVTFRRTPVSLLSAKVLPLTVFGFAIMLATGGLLFFAKPLVYYHNIWFRAKLIFLLLAFINIAYFHMRVQRDQAAWDRAAKPPAGARTSAVISITAWVLVITMGRLMAYSWFECGKPMPAWISAAQECSSASVDLAGLQP